MAVDTDKNEYGPALVRAASQRTLFSASLTVLTHSRPVPAPEVHQALLHAVISGLEQQDTVGLNSRIESLFNHIYCTQPPRAEVTKLLRPHHEGAGSPIWVGGA